MGEDFDWKWFINNLWERENALGLAGKEGKGGYSNGRYHPYHATNGWDVGPGFDMKYQSEAFKKKAYSEGFTKEELDDSIKARYVKELPFFEQRVVKEGGNPANISNEVIGGLLDIYHTRNNGLYSEFPNLWKAVASGDYEDMRKESRTGYYEENKPRIPEYWHWDDGRWEFRKNNYFRGPESTGLKAINPPIFDYSEKLDAIQPLNPFPAQTQKIKIPVAGSEKKEYVTESEKRKQQLRKAFKAKQDYDRIMEATNLQNTATPQFTSASSLFAKGGLLEPRDAWDRLSIPEKADIIKVGVKHGIFDLQELRKKYNEFKEGESKEEEEEEEEVNTEESYNQNIEAAAPDVSGYLANIDLSKLNYNMYSLTEHSIGEPLIEAANYRDENIYGLGDWLKKGLNWLKNSAQVAAIAESPSVMTAAGHRVTREGKAVQDRQNSKDVKQLRQNLANFGEGALGAMTATGDVEAAYNVLRHPIQTARALKEGAKELSRSAADGIEQQAIKLGFNFNKKSNLSDDFIGESLQAAKDYKSSEGYRQLVKNSIKESKQIGTGDFPEETFFTGIHKETPGIIFEERPKGHVASYNKTENIMRLDPNQISNGEEVPFHEGLHWQRVGKPELDIGPKYEKWSNSLMNGASDNESLAAFLDFFNSPEYIKYQQRGNAEAFLEKKVANVLYEDRINDSELGKASELIAHSLEAGKAQGIKPFSSYPGYTEAIKAIDKARKYDSYLYDIKAGSEDEIKNFWKLLTGNYIPSVTLGGIMTKTLKD